MCDLDEDKSDRNNDDFNTESVFTSTYEVANIKGLFDPLEENLNASTCFITQGNVTCGSGFIICNQAQFLPISTPDGNDHW